LTAAVCFFGDHQCAAYIDKMNNQPPFVLQTLHFSIILFIARRDVNMTNHKISIGSHLCDHAERIR